jgi:hypothetical protein
MLRKTQVKLRKMCSNKDKSGGTQQPTVNVQQYFTVEA